jgi:enamine deaminase RidA (YjgF/YER057c/UK114 family)
LEGVRSIGQESARHAAQSAAEEVGEGPPVSATSPEFATRKYAYAVMRRVEFQGGSVRAIGAKDRLVWLVLIRRSFFLENLLMLTLQPAEWSKPRGFSHGVAVDGPGRWIVLAGQTGGDEKGEYQSDMAGQVGMALRRIVKLLAEAGAGPEHIVRLTWYLINRSEYEAAGAAIGAAWRETLGRNFPPSTLLYISGLVDERAKVEIEVTAFVPAIEDVSR